ncbi:hypothetical protein B0T16DRAFT_407468 [Cercophora newfieldiana]|uniref:Uncharacterized protein n=1 Tax=Cercophora newfieldiana TaxID=92897 RepID=A0AA40CVJ2_9PEZI|nr:hypothetical protein B0T16DRAFT_407468 [Cercophora newfieldiana]
MSISRASTETVGRGDMAARFRPRRVAGTLGPEGVPEHLLRDPSLDPNSAKRLIVAVDFGTTYSAVAYVALEEGEDPAYLDPSRICTVRNFPDDATFGNLDDQMRSEVPTEVIYPLDRHFRDKIAKGPASWNQLEEHGDREADHDVDLYDFDEGDEWLPFEREQPGRHGFQDDSGLAVFGQQGNDGHDPGQMETDEDNSFRWGYAAHEAWGRSATHAGANSKPLSRFKLLLDQSARTESIRADLWRTLDELKVKRVISKPLDVIVDFLASLLRHAKSGIENAGFDDSYRREMVLCVPAIWTQKACRDMQGALGKAMAMAGFPGVDTETNTIDNFFIVSEPEAAAAFVLTNERDISPEDTFVLLDAGGGTVDANTYTVSTATPLRLTKEVVEPGGGLHGSSYINQGFRQLLWDKLRNERYLNTEENTIRGCIEKIIINDFEYKLKRSFDCYTARGVKYFDLPGLRPNKDKNFGRGSFQIPVREIQAIFLERLEGIGHIMEQQIQAALGKDIKVEKVVLIGGFAGSISLRRYLQDRLKKFCREKNYPLPQLLCPNNTATAVARGAVLRAFNKERGPARHARTSYGVLRTEPYGDFPEEHSEANWTWDKHDGMAYVKGTIDWVFKLGQVVQPVWTCREFTCRHTFDYSPHAKLICLDLLYASDKSTESHYQLKHPKNAGAEKVGEIEVDFTFLRERGLIRPVKASVDAKGRTIGKRHYRVDYTMLIKIVDRDLQCFAIFQGKVMEKCKINIASAFRPGVK